jgi:ABC-type uncharacterized transport system permease subunit
MKTHIYKFGDFPPHIFGNWKPLNSLISFFFFFNFSFWQYIANIKYISYEIVTIQPTRWSKLKQFGQQYGQMCPYMIKLTSNLLFQISKIYSKYGSSTMPKHGKYDYTHDQVYSCKCHSTM